MESTGRLLISSFYKPGNIETSRKIVNFFLSVGRDKMSCMHTNAIYVISRENTFALDILTILQQPTNGPDIVRCIATTTAFIARWLLKCSDPRMVSISGALLLEVARRFSQNSTTIIITYPKLVTGPWILSSRGAYCIIPNSSLSLASRGKTHKLQ